MTLLFLNALFGLVAFDLLLAIGKFAAVHRTLRRRKVANAHGTADVTEQVLRAVNLACMWYPKRALCFGTFERCRWSMLRTGIGYELSLARFQNEERCRPNMRVFLVPRNAPRATALIPRGRHPVEWPRG